jgi:hypothetical protein
MHPPWQYPFINGFFRSHRVFLCHGQHGPFHLPYGPLNPIHILNRYRPQAFLSLFIASDTRCRSKVYPVQYLDEIIKIFSSITDAFVQPIRFASFPMVNPCTEMEKMTTT